MAVTNGGRALIGGVFLAAGTLGLLYSTLALTRAPVAVTVQVGECYRLRQPPERWEPEIIIQVREVGRERARAVYWNRDHWMDHAEYPASVRMERLGQLWARVRCPAGWMGG